MARLPARDRRRALRDRRDGQDRRALLLLQAAPASPRNALPQWFPGIGIEGRKINLVPVDFVAKAMDHIAHIDGFDGQAFHLTDPNPLTAGQVINVFAKAAHAPEAAMRIDSRMFDFIPKQVRMGLTMLPPVKRISDQVLADLGIPRQVLVYINYPTDFDSTKTQAALEGTGISAAARQLRGAALGLLGAQTRPRPVQGSPSSGAIGGKVVLITGASSGIGKAAAIKCAEGAEVLLVAPPRRNSRRPRPDRGGRRHRPHPPMRLEHRGRRADGEEVLEQHGRVDVLVNNAGRSIRRSVELSYERFHDFERTMQLNYFGALRLILSLLPAMRKPSKGRKGGQIINVSSIGVQTHTPASRPTSPALDAWSRCVASEMATTTTSPRSTCLW